MQIEPVMKFSAAKSSGDSAPRAGKPEISERPGQSASVIRASVCLAAALIGCIWLIMAPSHPIMFDRDRLRKRRDKAAASFDQFDFLKVRVCDDLMERLADTPHQFERALDLGCHTGQLAQRLAGYPGIGRVEASDLSLGMVERAQAAGIHAIQVDEERLPYEVASFDLVVNALSLHWVNDLPGALIQIRRTLKPDGLFLGALFGGGTLHELRTSLMEAEAELTGGAGARVSPMPRLQDMASLMQRAGFALPVVDLDRVTVRYGSVFKLLADLGGMAERAAFASGQSRGLSRRILMRMAEIYAERFSDPDGKVRAEFEIIYLSGWAPAPNQPKPKRPGSATVSLADALGTKEHKTGEKPGT